MVETPQSLTADLLKQKLEEGRKHAAKEGDGRGPLYDQDRKFLGIVPASSQATRGFIYGIWLAIVEGTSGNVINFFGERLGPLATRMLKGDATRGKAAAKLVGAGVTIGVAAAPFIGDIFTSASVEKKKQDVTAKKTRALLEEVTGKSGIQALMGITAEQNEVLYVQRKRYEADMQQKLKDDLVMLGTSTAPTAIMSVGKHGELKDLFGKVVQGTKEGASGGLLSGLGLGSVGIAGLAPQVGEMLNEESVRQYKLQRQPYSALEMIVHLDEQLRDVDFSGDNFTDNFTLPEKGGSKSLAGYIAEVFKQHQRDMENINAEHSPLRSALSSQLEEISKDIAEAIKRGDIAPLAIARLAGEGAVIKNRGRSLAKPSEVRTTLQKMSSSALNYLQVESADYYGESSFSRKDLKTALDSLDGEDRIVFAALVPDDILKEAGVSQGDIQKIRDTSSKAYEQKLAQIVTGLAGYDDQKLGDLGLAKEEIEQLRKVAKEVKSKGEESIHEFRAKPTDPAGIERVVTNAVVNRVQGNKEYLGSLIQKGQVLMQEAPQADEASATDVAAEASENVSSDAHEIADAAPKADKADIAEETEEKGAFAAKEEARRDAAEEADESLQMAV